MSCQLNQTMGSTHNHRAPGHFDLFLRASAPPASVNGTNSQRLQLGGHAYSQNSDADVGGDILDSRMTGFPNLTIARPRNKPKAKASQSNAVNRLCRGDAGAVG